MALSPVRSDNEWARAKYYPGMTTVILAVDLLVRKSRRFLK